HQHGVAARRAGRLLDLPSLGAVNPAYLWRRIRGLLLLRPRVDRRQLGPAQGNQAGVFTRHHRRADSRCPVLTSVARSWSPRTDAMAWGRAAGAAGGS